MSSDREYDWLTWFKIYAIAIELEYRLKRPYYPPPQDDEDKALNDMLDQADRFYDEGLVDIIPANDSWQDFREDVQFMRSFIAYHPSKFQDPNWSIYVNMLDDMEAAIPTTSSGT